MKKSRKGPLEIMFPDQEVTLQSGQKVIMSPLPLDDMALMLDTYGRLLIMRAAGHSPTQLLMVMGVPVVSLIKRCLRGVDVKDEDLRLSAADFWTLFDIFLTQNIDETILGKANALIGRLRGLLPEFEEIASKIQSETSQVQSNSLSGTDTETSNSSKE